MAFVPFTGELDPPEKQASQFVPFTGELDPPKEPQEQLKEEDESFLRSIADVPLSLGRGAVQGVRFLADTFGADNPVSNALRSTEGYIGDLMSAGAKRDAKEISRIMKEAEDKGVGAQLLAALKALTVAPVDLVTQALGTAAPTILGGIAGLAVKGGLKAGATAAQIASGSKLAGQIGAGVGGAMGAGVVKSTIYDVVYEEVLKKTKSEEIAKAKAQEAQSYTGDNWDSILGGTALGTIAGITGIEKNIVGRLSAKKAAQEAGEKAATEGTKTVAKESILGAAAREAVPEGAQAGQEQLAGNIALQREGFDVPTFRGVAGNIALEGLLGAGVGGGAEATGRLVTPQGQQETQELKDLEKLSDQEKVVTTSEDKIAPVFDQLVDQYKAEGATEAEAFKLAGQAILVQRLDDVSKGVVDVTDTEAEPGAGESSVSVPSGEETVSEPAPGVEGIEPAGVAAVGDIPSSVGETEGAGVPSLDAAIQARANELIAEAADLGATIPMDVAIEKATTELTETIEPDVTSEVTTTESTSTSKFSPAYIEVGTLQKKLKELGNRYLELKTKINSYYGGDTLGRPTGPRKGSKRFNEAQALGEETTKILTEYQETETAFKQARDAYMADPANQEEIAKLRAEREAPADTTPADTTPADTTPADTTPADTTPADTTPADTTPATTATPAETKLKPQGKPRGRKPVVRTPEEQAEAEAQRKQRQAIGRDAIREADKAQAVITREFNLDDYATEDAAKASALELLQERQGALVAAYNTMANKSLAPNSKAKQTAQAVINHESVTDKERRDAQARIAATEQTTARSDLLTGATNQDLDATYLVEDFGTATKAIEYIMRTGSAFEKLLSQRIKPFLKGVKLVIVNNPERDIPNAKLRRKFRGATGMYAETAKGERTIYLSNIANLEGISNMTFLHEAVHGATMAQINAYIKNPNSVSPQAREAIKSMNDIMLKAYAYYAILKAGGRSVRGVDSIALDDMDKLKVFIDLKEFVAYGLTQPEMQQFLSAIPGNYGSSNKYGAFNKFIDAIRKIFNLGPQYKSAFIDLVAVTDQLLSARGPVPSKNTIIAAANKVANKTKLSTKSIEAKVLQR
jgi:hypothetical protein